MNKVVDNNSGQNLFFVFILGCWPLMRSLKFIPSIPVWLYYGVFLICFIYLVSKDSNFKVNACVITFIVSSSISLLLNDVDPNYRAWERLGGCCLVVACYGPLMCNETVNEIRYLALNISLWTCTIIGVLSFCLYLIVPAYTITERGLLFGGITTHSMLMGPIAGLGLLNTIRYYKDFKQYELREKIILPLISIMNFFACVLAGSRSALLCTLVAILTWLFLSLKDNKKLFLHICIAIAVCLSVTAPWWWQYTETIQKKVAFSQSQGSMLNSRMGRWESRIDEIKKSPIIGCGFATVDGPASENGTVESGNGWLFVWSSAGIISFICLASIVLKALARLRLIDDEKAWLCICLLLFFILHQMAEGYIISAGHPLCALLWLSLGVSYGVLQTFDYI